VILIYILITTFKGDTLMIVGDDFPL